MKHLATIQTEFLKEARTWDDLTFEDQRAYLKRHPQSKRKITSQTSERNRHGELKDFEILTNGTGISSKQRLKNREQNKFKTGAPASEIRQDLHHEYRQRLKDLSKIKNLRSAPEARKRKTILNEMVEIIKENDRLGGRPMLMLKLKKRS